jgi:hypothetical protein
MPRIVRHTLNQGCASGAGFIGIEEVGGVPLNSTIIWSLIAVSTGADYGTSFPLDGPMPTARGLPDDTYKSSIYADDGTYTYTGDEQTKEVDCVPTASGLKLDKLTHTDETAALDDGTATIQASGGTAPLTAKLVELNLSQPATSGQPVQFSDLPPSTYNLQTVDANGQSVGGKVTILPYSAPVTGCQDEYASNYNSAASTASSCTYEPLWRSAWGPTNVAVAVPAVVGQVKAYIEAQLFIGFRPGHPLAADRPLGAPISLKATVGPQGYAVFRLGPYLRSALGADDGLGGRRLDLNSSTATTADLYVGYELRRTSGEMLEHGYVVNAAVPDDVLTSTPGNRLTPFWPLLPIWPGFDDYLVPFLTSFNLGKYGEVLEEAALHFDTRLMPCPTNPLPVRWLAPQGGYGYWVFQGKPQLGDDVGEGQTFTEAGTGERRYSQRGEARGTVQASTGIFNGPQFAEGLRTLWASTQVWYQREPSGDWVPVTLAGGTFPVRRMGLARTELAVTFTEARPHYAQGQ